jgi:uncharacterized delta-60 repeat protein
MKKILILSAWFILTNICLQAQPGTLDGDFDADEKVTTDITGGDDWCKSVVVQPDGRIILAGNSSAVTEDAAFIRYYPDGSVDQSFGTNGKVVLDINGADDYINSMILQEDGKIVAGGYTTTASEEDFLILRLNADGSLDNSFSFDGMVTTDFDGATDELNSIAFDNEVNFLAVGLCCIGTEVEFATVRYLADGSLDQSFSEDGRQTVSFGNGIDVANGVAIQPDGKIVVAGQANYNGNWDIGLIRYNTDGSPDQTFSYDGKVVTDILSSTDNAFAIKLQPDGKIVVTGRTFNSVDQDFFLVRYNQDGNLDATFSDDGKQVTDMGQGNDEGNSLILQPDGKILVAGCSVINMYHHFMLARYDMTGNLDTAFADGGVTITPFSPNIDCGKSVTLQPNGRIVLAGHANITGNYDFALARYLSGLNIGFLDFTDAENNVLICPNPVEQNALLKYSLRNSCVIMVQLFDPAGRLIETIIPGEYQVEGDHTVALTFNQGINPGNYLLVFSSGGKKDCG